MGHAQDPAPSNSFLASAAIILILYVISIISHPFSFEIILPIIIFSMHARIAVNKLAPMWISTICLSSIVMWMSTSSELLHFSMISFMYPSAKFIADADVSGFMSTANGVVFLVLATLPFIDPSKAWPQAVQRSKLEIFGASVVIVPLCLVLKINTLIVWLGVSQIPGRSGIALTNNTQINPFVILLLAGATWAAGVALGALMLINKRR